MKSLEAKWKEKQSKEKKRNENQIYFTIFLFPPLPLQFLFTFFYLVLPAFFMFSILILTLLIFFAASNLLGFLHATYFSYVCLFHIFDHAFFLEFFACLIYFCISWTFFTGILHRVCSFHVFKTYFLQVSSYFPVFLQSPFCCLFWPFRKWRKRKFSIRKFCSFLKEDVLAAIICLMDFLAPFDRSLIQSFRLFVQRQRQHHYRRRRQHFTKEKIAAQN